MKLSKPRKLFIFITLFIAFSDGLFVWINYKASREAMLAQLSEEMTESKVAFDLTLENTTSALIQLATYVAGDQRVQQLFLQGKQAVAEEGGGAGGARAAELRTQLYELVKPSWQRMQKQFLARQLHFHLGPGSTSFLRVHKPQKFGDNMDNVRYTIVDANKWLQPTRGFETGRVYSGIRGVVPVFAKDEGRSEKEHAGALEAGTSFSLLLDIVESHTQARFAVLLTLKHMQANVWPDFLARMTQKNPPINEHFIEASRHEEELRRLLTSFDWSARAPDNSVQLLKDGQRTLVISSFPLLDYHAQRDPLLGPVGKVLIWRDAQKALAAFESQFRINIFFAVAAFLTLELVLFFGIKRVTRGLQRIIDQRTGELADANFELSQRNMDLESSMQELSRTRDRLIESEKLASLGGLVAGVAHEINTPVGIGLTASSHMQEKVQGFERKFHAGNLSKSDLQQFVDDSKRANEMVLGNLGRAADLVQSFKQMASDQATESKRIFNLEKYLQEVLLSLHPRLKNTNVQVQVHCAEDIVIESYPGAIAQVFTNLIINSLEHAFDKGQGGAITISCHLPPEGVLSLRYRDNGRGIPHSSREKVFEPFFTTRRHAGGTGLGLSIVYNIVTGQLNGNIALEDNLPQGTGFMMSFPVEIPEQSGTTETET